MKFNCGMTRAEKRRLRREERNRLYSNGFYKFAWLPIRVGRNDCRWLEHVWAVGTWYKSPLGGFWHWQYSAVNDA